MRVGFLIRYEIKAGNETVAESYLARPVDPVRSRSERGGDPGLDGS